MEHIEIERKFLLPVLLDDLKHYPHREFLQGYLSTSPTVHVRREGEAYVLTYKGSGLLKREEHNPSLMAGGFVRLLEKCDGLHIRKTRYLIPLSGTAYIAGFDRFQGEFTGFLLVRIKFPDEASVRTFTPPIWFGGEVTGGPRYQDSSFGRFGLPGEERA